MILKYLKFKLVLLLIFFVCSPVIAKNLELNASIKDNVLLFSIKNDTNNGIKINRMFSLDPILGSIRVQVKRGGHLLRIRGQIDGNMPTTEFYVTIYPGQFYGGSIDIDLLKRLYGMNHGCYSLTLFYKDAFAPKFGAYPKEISSDSVRVCIR